MTTTTWRRAAALAGVALTASALPFLSATSAQAATSVDEELDYTCLVTAIYDGTELPLEGQTIKVRTQFSVPTLTPGSTVPKTRVGITLTLDKALQEVTTVGLKGTTVSGSSTDTRLELRAGGKSAFYPISGLSTTNAPIEQDLEKPWRIPITGTSPVIPTPDVSSVELLAPERFTVKSTINASDGRKIPTNLDCVAPEDRVLATVGVVKNMPAMTAGVSPSTIVANRTRASLVVRTDAPKQATGVVHVRSEDGRVIAAGLLNMGSIFVFY